MASTAVLYTKVSSHQREDGMKLVERLSLTKGCTVLDFGCGTGYLTNMMTKLVGPNGKVIGVDRDAERIRVAQEAYGDNCNMQFLQGDHKYLPPGPYDVVFSNHVIHWIEDKDTIFKNVFENLKVGGRFAIVVTGLLSQIIYDLDDLLPTGKTKQLDSIFPCPLAEYDELAAKYDFSVDFHCEEPKAYRFGGIEKFLQWLHASSGGVFDHLSIDRNLLLSRYNEDSIQYNWNRISCIYRKA